MNQRRTWKRKGVLDAKTLSSIHPITSHRTVRWEETGTWPWRSACQHVSLSPRLSPSLRHHSSRPSRNFPHSTLSYFLTRCFLYSNLLYSNRAFQSSDTPSHHWHPNSLQASQQPSSPPPTLILRWPTPSIPLVCFISLFVWSIKLTLKQISSGLALNQHCFMIHHCIAPDFYSRNRYLSSARGDFIAFMFWS